MFKYAIDEIVARREIWEQSKWSFKEKSVDIHTKLMRRYKQVPEWWFVCILAATIAATVFTCEYYKAQLQLPWWGVLLACAVAIFFTLPIGIITAITNQVNTFRYCVSGCNNFNHETDICTEPGLEHNNGIHHRVCVPGISSGKHVLQGVWLH